MVQVEALEAYCCTGPLCRTAEPADSGRPTVVLMEAADSSAGVPSDSGSLDARDEVCNLELQSLILEVPANMTDVDNQVAAARSSQRSYVIVVVEHHSETVQEDTVAALEMLELVLVNIHSYSAIVQAQAVGKPAVDTGVAVAAS